MNEKEIERRINAKSREINDNYDRLISSARQVGFASSSAMASYSRLTLLIPIAIIVVLAIVFVNMNHPLIGLLVGGGGIYFTVNMHRNTSRNVTNVNNYQTRLNNDLDSLQKLDI